MDDNQRTGALAAAPLTDRVNGQPAILKGLSSKEAGLAMAVAFPAWFLLGIAAGFVTGIWMLLVALGVFGPLATVWVGAGFMAKLKRNRPDHYHLHLAMNWLHKVGVRKTRLIHLDGAWDLGRSMPQIPGAQEGWLMRAKRMFRL